MPHMKRISLALIVTAAFALALPALAPATLTEVGVIGETTPATAPSCPGTPCLAVSRTTGFQVKVATANNLVSAPREGTIVAWTITLGNPNPPRSSTSTPTRVAPPKPGSRSWLLKRSQT